MQGILNEAIAIYMSRDDFNPKIHKILQILMKRDQILTLNSKNDDTNYSCRRLEELYKDIAFFLQLNNFNMEEL